MELAVRMKKTATKDQLRKAGLVQLPGPHLKMVNRNQRHWLNR